MIRVKLSLVCGCCEQTQKIRGRAEVAPAKCYDGDAREERNKDQWTREIGIRMTLAAPCRSDSDSCILLPLCPLIIQKPVYH